MKTGRRSRRFGSALLGAVGVAGGVWLAGPAAAQPALGPFFAPPPGGGPYTWCPGDSLGEGISPQTGKGSPGVNTQWDMNVCHTWYFVNWGYGNISPAVWDGPDPPPEGTAIRQCPPISFMCP